MRRVRHPVAAATDAREPDNPTSPSPSAALSLTKRMSGLAVLMFFRGSRLK